MIHRLSGIAFIFYPPIPSPTTQLPCSYVDVRHLSNRSPEVHLLLRALCGRLRLAVYQLLRLLHLSVLGRSLLDPGYFRNTRLPKRAGLDQ